MLYSLFGSNRPVVVSLLIVPALVYAGLVAGFGIPGDFVIGGPAYDGLKLLIPGAVPHLIVGVVINLLSAYLVNRIFNAHSYGDRENYFPALFYFLFVSLEPSWNYVNPVMTANLFLLLALRRLLRMYRVQEVTGMIFDAGVFIGIAVLLYWPLILVVPLLWLSLIQLRTFNIREWLVPFSGLAVPAIYAAVACWWFDVKRGIPAWNELSADPDTAIFQGHNLWFWLVFIFTLFVFLVGLAGFLREMQVSTVHKKNTKKVFVTLTVLLIVVWVAAFFTGVHHPVLTGLLVIPLSVYSGIFFSRARRRKWHIVVFYIWLALLVIFPLWNLFS